MRSVSVCGYEMWSLYAEDVRRCEVFEHRCLLIVARIKRKDCEINASFGNLLFGTSSVNVTSALLLRGLSGKDPSSSWLAILSAMIVNHGHWRPCCQFMYNRDDAKDCVCTFKLHSLRWPLFRPSDLHRVQFAYSLFS